MQCFLALLIALLASAGTHAVTLGQARVVSYLNQPLEAEIALVGVEPGQHEDLRIRVANQDQFDRLGIPFTFFMNDLNFDVVQSRGQWIVRVRSRKPVTEPFLDFPVQMTWPGGQMVRQYTLLLDPLTLSRPATVTRAARPAATRQTATPTAAPPVGNLPSSATYGPVRSGETLWPIAQKLRPRGITTKQMAMALLRANPQAFIDNNINKLRAGAVLTVPPLGEIQQLDAATAAREFAEQVRQWRAPVATSPRQAAVSAPITAPATTQQAATPSDQVPEASETAPTVTSPPDTAADAAEAKLRIVTDQQTDEETSSEGAIQKQLLVTMEEIESNRITTSAIESRLAKLEEELTSMQALVELKDQQIAALQSEIDARDEIEKAADAAGATLPDAAPAPSSPIIEQETAAVAPAPATDLAEAETPVTIAAEPLPAPEPAMRPPWYDQYLWLIWALLGLIGLVAVGLMIRRQMVTQNQSNVPMADLPSSPPSTYGREREPAREEIKQAERDFRSMSDTSAAAIEPATPPAERLPDMDKSAAQAVDQRIEGLTNSMLDEMLEDGKHLGGRPPAAAPDADVSEDDIESWMEELGSEIDQLESATTEKPAATKPTQTELPIDDDIPSILHELDDKLAPKDNELVADTANIQLDPLDDDFPTAADAAKFTDDTPSVTQLEDDTFHMSLDLARAYLEIGDQDGARDMLKQALGGARNPDQRRQIEELLQQIDQV